MNEITKTLALGAVAGVSALIALVSRPSTVTVRPESEVGKPLCADFKDPLAAKSLKIVQFDESVSEATELEVRETNGIWTLPSHENYPADAENRVRDATTPFVDLNLKVIDVVSDKESEHALYGVIEPGAAKAGVGAQGVGTLVTVKDKDGKSLVNLIIGKADKKNAELRYVRRPGQRHVFVAKVDPTKLPVKFEEWIERDLLKLNAWDISQLVLKDYSFQVSSGLRGPVPDYDPRLEVTLSDDNGKWKLDSMQVAGSDGLEPATLKETEELNAERINGLKDALDRLEIVDVERKPSGLGEDLRTNKGFFEDETGVDSLLQKGFYPVQMGSNPDEVELLSSDGEVVARTKEGVEYVLRFGRVQGVEAGSADGKLNRYLLVSARVNEAQFPEPELELVPNSVDEIKTPAAPAGIPTTTPPALPPASAAPQSSRVDSDGATQLVAFQQPEGEAEAAGDTAADAAAEATTEPASNADPAATADAPAQEQATASAEDAEATNAPEGEAPASDNNASPSAPADTTAAPEASSDPAASTGDAAPASTPAASSPEEDQKRLQAEQERVMKDNQRKIDERKANLAKAQKKVNELNYRFADWYYVISEDVYKKIHLSQVDIVKEKEEAAKNEGFGVDALQGLQPPQ